MVPVRQGDRIATPEGLELVALARFTVASWNEEPTQFIWDGKHPVNSTDLAYRPNMALQRGY